jgi:hypothetical protein
MLKRFLGLCTLLTACQPGSAGAPDDTVPADTDAARDTDGPSDSDAATDSDTVACAYPEGAVEPMAINEVLSPYRWPKAIDGTGRNVPLDLAKVPCDDDEEIDWSPFDVLLFVSIPAW